MPEASEGRFEANVRRVEHLLTLYRGLRRGRGRRPVNSTDVLRAAVVLLHATLEDLLRTCERAKLPHASAPQLDDVPIVGQGPNPKKFLLGELAEHRSKTVQQLIEESVHDHLTLTTYNNAEQVMATMRRCGLNPDPIRALMQQINAMMKRRHHIVHQADRDERRGTGHYSAQSLSIAKVEKWVGVVRAWGSEVLRQMKAV